MEQFKLDSNYWNDRYFSGNTGWDIQSVSRPIKEYLEQLSNHNLSILIPGCGNAHDAIYANSIGFDNIHILDFADVAVRNFISKHPNFKKDNIHIEDIFLHHKKYDLIIEQTLFCALDPSLRINYAQKMHDMLNEGGKLVGLLFDRDFQDGPPFGGNKEEYLNYFSPLFNIKIFEKCYNSIEPRMGSELFIILEKK
jgi:SAM-dependent methyltransferase